MTQALPDLLLQVQIPPVPPLQARALQVRPLRNDAPNLLYNPLHESASMSPARRSSKLSGSALPSYDEVSALVAAYAAKLARIRPSIERVRLNQALDRVLAESLRADTDQPPFPRSTRDGFACRAAEASTHRPLSVAGSTRAGQTPSDPLPRGAVWEIMTGAPVPAGADAVIMLEHVEESGSASNRTIRLLPPRTVRKGE